MRKTLLEIIVGALFFTLHDMLHPRNTYFLDEVNSPSERLMLHINNTWTYNANM